MKRKTKAQSLFENFNKRNKGRDRRLFEIAKDDFTDYLIKLAYRKKLYYEDSKGEIRPVNNLSREND